MVIIFKTFRIKEEGVMKIANIIGKTKKTVGMVVGNIVETAECCKKAVDKYVEITTHCGNIALTGCNALSKASTEIETEIALIKNNAKQIAEIQLNETKVEKFAASYAV
jgi:hypothetical protein